MLINKYDHTYYNADELGPALVFVGIERKLVSNMIHGINILDRSLDCFLLHDSKDTIRDNKDGVYCFNVKIDKCLVVKDDQVIIEWD